MTARQQKYSLCLIIHSKFFKNIFISFPFFKPFLTDSESLVGQQTSGRNFTLQPVFSPFRGVPQQTPFKIYTVHACVYVSNIQYQVSFYVLLEIVISLVADLASCNSNLDNNNN